MLSLHFDRWTSMLVTQTTQVTLLATLAWCVTRLFAKDRPHLAHAIWILVLVKCITPPVLSSPGSPFSWMQTKCGTIRSTPQVDPASPVFSVTVGSLLVEEKRKAPDALNLAEPWESSTSSNPQRHSGSTLFACIWLTGVAIGLFVAVSRVVLYRQWLRKNRRIDSPFAESVVQSLKSQLGIRRSVRLLILDGPVGPAVIGLLRPTILLPASVIAGKTRHQIEPLLAHEMIHIRRGDLGWALIQTLATSLFWFHPLVWVASRMVTRESERSCDEETVASLSCHPAAYARSLLDVLEQKHKWKSGLRMAPALPGVRPVDITSARLERVMKLGNGSLKRTPLWIWCVAIFCGAMVLPGAALVFAQESPERGSQDEDERLQLPVVSSPLITQEPTKKILVDPENEPRIVIKETGVPLLGKIPYVNGLFKNVGIARQNALAVDNYNLIKIDATGVLRDLQNQELGIQTPEERLISLLPCRYPGDHGESSTPDGKSAYYEFESGKKIKLGNDEPTIKLVGETLFVLGEPEYVRDVEQRIDSFEKHGCHQISVDVQLISLSQAEFSKLDIQWSKTNSDGDVQNTGTLSTQGPQTVVAASHTSVENRKPAVNAASYVGKSAHSQYAMLNPSEVGSLVANAKQCKEATLLSTPQIVVVNGQTANIMQGQKRPFVVGFEFKQADDNSQTVAQPVVQSVLDGISIDLCPMLKTQDNGPAGFSLKSNLTMAYIRSVGVEDLPTVDGIPCKVQTPVVETSQINSSLDIPTNKTLVLCCSFGNRNGHNEKLLACIDCKLVGSSDVDAKPRTTEPAQGK